MWRAPNALQQLSGNPADCVHAGLACNCAVNPSGLEQSLPELEFARSACAAAQTGNVVKLERILKRSPQAVHHDGGAGEVMRLVLFTL